MAFVAEYSRPQHWTRAEQFKFILCLAVTAAVAGLFLLAYLSRKNSPVTDAAGCLCGHAPTGHILVLVDNTDAFSPPQIDGLKQALAGAGRDVLPWGMLMIANIGSSVPARVIFSNCSPEKGVPFGFWESLRRRQDNWLQLKAEYQRKFQKPVAALIENIALNKTMPHSPIIQQLADLLAELGPRWNGVEHKTIIIFSDLLENTPEFSQYDAAVNRKRFAAAQESVPYIRNARLDLRNTDVKVFYLTGLADHRLQGASHQDFWRSLISYYGGRVTGWTPLPYQPEGGLEAINAN